MTTDGNGAQLIARITAQQFFANIGFYQEFFTAHYVNQEVVTISPRQYDSDGMPLLFLLVLEDGQVCTVAYSARILIARRNATNG